MLVPENGLKESTRPTASRVKGRENSVNHVSNSPVHLGPAPDSALSAVGAQRARIGDLTSRMWERESPKRGAKHNPWFP